MLNIETHILLYVTDNDTETMIKKQRGKKKSSAIGFSVITFKEGKEIT